MYISKNIKLSVQIPHFYENAGFDSANKLRNLRRKEFTLHKLYTDMHCKRIELFRHLPQKHLRRAGHWRETCVSAC